jgi:hypothetical protein
MCAAQSVGQSRQDGYQAGLKGFAEAVSVSCHVLVTMLTPKLNVEKAQHLDGCLGNLGKSSSLAAITIFPISTGGWRRTYVV